MAFDISLIGPRNPGIEDVEEDHRELLPNQLCELLQLAIRIECVGGVSADEVAFVGRSQVNRSLLLLLTIIISAAAAAPSVCL